MEGKKTHHVFFSYKAEDASGKIHIGRASAPSAGSLRRLLQKKGYTILSVSREKTLWERFREGKMSVKDRSMFYRELATMLKAGVSITEAIDTLAEVPNKRVQLILQDVSKSLQNGFTLSVAMASFPKAFPPVEVGVIKAGEASGNLVKVLLDLSVSTARTAEFSSRVRGAMVYPGFILAVMIIVGSIIIVKVIPPIKSIFETADTQLPATTKILLWFTDMLVHYWWLVILLLAVIVLGARLYALTKSGKRFFSWLALNFPVFGLLNQQTYLARFNRTMSLLISAGVPILQSVKIVVDSTENVIFRQALQGLMRSLEQGSPISISLQNNRYFPRLMTQLLYVGQQSGDLGGTTATLADFFEGEVDNRLRQFSALIEPFIIVLLGVAIGFIVIAVLQPIYNLTGAF